MVSCTLNKEKLSTNLYSTEGDDVDSISISQPAEESNFEKWLESYLGTEEELSDRNERRLKDKQYDVETEFETKEESHKLSKFSLFDLHQSEEHESPTYSEDQMYIVKLIGFANFNKLSNDQKEFLLKHCGSLDLGPDIDIISLSNIYEESYE